MKTIAIAFFATVFSLSVFSQNQIENIFLGIWNNYRFNNRLTVAFCDFQQYQKVYLSENYEVIVYSLDENRDTVYTRTTCTGDSKKIPRYHDKNTSLLFQVIDSNRIDDSNLPEIYKKYVSSEEYSRASDYLDSLQLSQAFQKMLSIDEYKEIILSNRYLYFHIKALQSKDTQTLTISFFEILDSNLSLVPAEYGATKVSKGNFERLKPYIVDEFTKKLKY